MSLTYVTSSGEIISPDENAGPFQFTPEGFNTGLSVSSVPLAQWEGGTASFSDLYRRQPWVYITVNFMARQLSRLPLKVVELDSQNVKRPVRSGQLWESLQKPARRRGPIHLKQWLAFPALLHGNGTVEKVRGRAGAPPLGFRALDWRFMDPQRDRDGEITHWIYRGAKDPRIIHLDDLIHAAWQGPGDLGVSPLAALRTTIMLEQGAQQWMTGHFRNSARPSGGLAMPEVAAGQGKDAKALRSEIRDDLDRLHAGGRNNGRPILLPPGAKWQTFEQSAHEVELIDQRKLNREEVAAAYNAPQPMIGILDHATYSNIAELHKILYGPVLGPWLVLFEETLKAQLIDNEPALEGQFVEFELGEVLRGDVLKEALALKTQLQTGMLTINEARQIRNLPPIDHPDCDRPMIPTNNMTFVGGVTDDAASALAKNLARAGNRLYRHAKAGRDGWDAERFERELREDLDLEGAADAERVARSWTGAVSAIVADAMGDPDVLRESFGALVPDTGDH